MKFGVRVRTLDFLPEPNFVKKILKGFVPLGANLYQKFQILTNLGDLYKPTFIMVQFKRKALITAPDRNQL